MQDKKAINIEIGQNLKFYREAAGLTQEAFAEILGLGVKHVSAMERGATGVSINTLWNASLALSIPADYFLFGRIDEMEKQTRDDEIQLLTTKLSRLSPKEFQTVKEILNKILEVLMWMVLALYNWDKRQVCFFDWNGKNE